MMIHYDQVQFISGMIDWFNMQKSIKGDSSGGPVVKNLPSNAGDSGSIPGQGTRIPHAGQCSIQKNKRSELKKSGPNLYGYRAELDKDSAFGELTL